MFIIIGVSLSRALSNPTLVNGISHDLRMYLSICHTSFRKQRIALLISEFNPNCCGILQTKLLSCFVCTAGLCFRSLQFVYMYVNKRKVVLCLTTQKSACSLSLSTSSAICYIQGAVQTEQFMFFFPNKTQRPPGLKIFSSELYHGGTPHPL